MKYLFDIDIPVHGGNAFLYGTVKDLGICRAIEVKMELTIGDKEAVLTAPCTALSTTMDESIACAIEGFTVFCGFDWDKTTDRKKLLEDIMDYAAMYRNDDWL